MKLCIVQIDCDVLPSNSILVPLVPLPWEQGGRLDTAEDSGYHNYPLSIQAGQILRKILPQILIH